MKNTEGFTFDPEEHRFSVNGVVWPSITQVLREAGMIDDRWFDEYSATRGSYVHKICELHEKGILDPKSVDDDLKGYFKA